jgi:hypothetical protein
MIAPMGIHFTLTICGAYDKVTTGARSPENHL